MERSVSTFQDRFDLDSLFTLQKYSVGQMAGVSIKDLASEAKWLGWDAAWGMSGVKFASGCYWVTLRGRTLLFALDELTAAQMFQRQCYHPVPFPKQDSMYKKRLHMNFHGSWVSYSS